ncbi:Tyrosine kinase domain protein [Ceratobasidium sp. AG-Ba]|nr:Tyrosine kinase domain protein [Ceratobasidium sp. AG-Ba]
MLEAELPNVIRIQQSDLSIEVDEIAKGGDANVYRGLLWSKENQPPIPVAIKRIRVDLYGEATRSVAQKKEKKIIREMTIWSALQAYSNPHPHIVPLLGVTESPNGLLDFVSEYCIDSLASYLNDYENKPRRIELMIGTLRGLTHMHNLSIVHGDLKSTNVLVTRDGSPKICDFGHSREFGDRSSDQLVRSDASSSFQATVRYMSPEFFRANKTKPTVFSDIWAFGCLSLEILSQLHPYHAIQSEFLIPSAIRSGASPSVKPEYPNAAGCLNDVLWGLVKQCWILIPTQRPTSSALLQSIHELVARGLVNPAATTPLKPVLSMDDELTPLPSGVPDYTALLKGFKKKSTVTGNNTKVFIYLHESSSHTAQPDQASNCVAKHISLNRETNDSASAHFALENVLRQTLKERYRFQHQNIIAILGIDSSGGQHLGYVLEYCIDITRKQYKNKMPQDENLYIKYMTHILNGLQYMHNRISPIPHGDLTPANILVDHSGILKLTAFSVSRLISKIPAKERKLLVENERVSVRYMSPELLQDGAQPTPESDIWAFGNIAFWIFSGLRPYSEYNAEHDVALQITKGALPNEPSQLMDLESLDDTEFPERCSWLTNGVWSAIMKCWSTTTSERPTATQFLRDLDNRSEMSERAGIYDKWNIPGVQDLTGRVRKSETRNYGASLGWSRGVWRGTYDGRGARTTYVELWCWKTTLSQGYFRSSLEYYDQHFHEMDSRAKHSLLSQLGKAIQYLHHEISQGAIIHGNLSMETILVDSNGALKLSNFEFACQYAHADNLLEAPVIFAPPLSPYPSRWHAPEFFEVATDSGWPNPTQFTDIWSTGCLVVAIWTNKLPFTDCDTPGAISHIMHGSKPYMQEDCPLIIWEFANRFWSSPFYDRILAKGFLEHLESLLFTHQVFRVLLREFLSIVGVFDGGVSNGKGAIS